MKPSLNNRASSNLNFALLAAFTMLGTSCGPDGTQGANPPSPTACKLATAVTADDFNLVKGKLSNPYDGVTEPSGAVIVTGYGYDAANIAHWVTRRSEDRGKTWKTVDDYQLAPQKSAGDYSNTRLFADSRGYVYAAGSAKDNLGKTHAITRVSEDRGKTWQFFDDYVLSAGENSVASDVYSNGKGEIFILAGGVEGGAPHIVLRKSTDNGATFTPVLNVPKVFDKGDTAYPTQFFRDLNGAFYILASGNATPLGARQNYLMRSQDDGVNWTVVDSFLEAGYKAMFPVQMAQAASGILYYTGGGTDSGGLTHSVIRSSFDGKIWDRLVNFEEDSHHHLLQPSGLAVDGNGWVQWLNNYSLGGTQAFASLDSNADPIKDPLVWQEAAFDEQAGIGAQASGGVFVSGALGDVYTTVIQGDVSGTGHWIVRQQLCE